MNAPSSRSARLRRWIGSSIAAAGVVVGCNSTVPSIGGNSSASGEVGGHPLNLLDTVIGFYPRTSNASGGAGTEAKMTIVLSSAGALCTHYEGAGGRLQHRDETWLSMSIHSPGKTMGSGTYAIRAVPKPEDGPYASAQFNIVDGVCKSTFAANATGGSITLDAVSGSDASGQYTLTFDGGGTLEGTFYRVFCPDVPDWNVPGCK